MKKLLLFSAAGIMCLAACKTPSDGSYTISGEIKGLKDSALFLAQQQDNMPHFDTIKVENGQFKFNGKTTHPVLAQVITADQSGGFPLFLEPGTIHVNGQADSLAFGKVNVSGTPNNDDLHAFMELQMPFVKEMMGMQSAYMQAGASGDTAAIAGMQQHMDSLQNAMTEAVKGFVKAHPRSLVSGMALQGMMNNMPAEELQGLYAGLDTSVQHSEFGQLVGTKLAAEKKTAVGEMAPDFTMNNTEGKPVSLSSFRGKYVLVDFWASWCGPCRRENPNVVKAYNRYKDKNFTILGVSLDQSKDDWLQAIKDDKLAWNQVSDLKYWENAAAQLYGVQAIPANFLIGPEGKIVAKDLRGEELEQKLAEVLQ